MEPSWILKDNDNIKTEKISLGKCFESSLSWLEFELR